MVLNKFTSNTLAEAGEVNANFAESFTQTGLNTIRQLIDRASIFSVNSIEGWGDAYIDSTGRENSVNTTDTTATFDTDKYKPTTIAKNIIHLIPFDTFGTTISTTIGVPLIEDWEGSDGAIDYKLEVDNTIPVVEIVASSISSISDFAINNCAIHSISSGVWRLLSSSADVEVARAEIMKTLFYGTDGSNPRAEATYITSPTAFKTNVSRDVGKRGHYIQQNENGAGTDPSYTGTFSNTTTNDSCSSWSILHSIGGAFIRWEMPSGTTLHTTVSNSDELGTNTTSDELDNPADCQIQGIAGASGAYAKVIILSEGSISWVSAGVGVFANTDFNVDNSIPDFTTLTIIADDSGWLQADTPIISSFTAFSNQPNKLTVRLTPKTSSPTTGYPSIRGFWVRAT